MAKFKQYFIGINIRSEEIILRLFELGATLMFYYHWQTIGLNEKFKFYDGEWMLHTSMGDDYSEIEQIRALLENESVKDDSFKFEIVPVKEWGV